MASRIASPRLVTLWTTIAAALLAGTVSILRILLTNEAALQTLVWAEDGLFPLCVKAHNPMSCAVDPFAGYLLFLPRLVAWPVSLFPLDAWPMATNVAAALLAALAAALTVVVLRAAGSGWVAALLVAILPTFAPIMGFEAINATGSSYMLLVFVAALAVCFPPTDRFPTWTFVAGALVLALTIPSSALLLVPLVVQVLRGRIPRSGGLWTGGALVIGLIAQAVVVLTADNPRPMNWSIDAARSWADTLPSALLTFWPGTTALTGEGSFTSAAAAGLGQVGLVLAAMVLAAGIVLACLRSPTASGVGLMLLVGLLLGVIPAAAGYANNRYFVIPALFWSAALLIALDRAVRWRPNAVMGIVAIALVVMWIPGLPSSEFRSTAVPEWAPMLEAARATCAGAPEGMVAITMSPSWPFSDAVFPGPTNNVVPCAIVGAP